MTRGQAVLLGTGIAVVCAGAVLAGLLISDPAGERRPSSYSGRGPGLLAARRLLEDLGVSAKPYTRPWTSLPPLGEGRRVLLIVATPLRRSPTSEECLALIDWLDSGGALLLSDDAHALSRSRAFDTLLAGSLGLGADPAPPDMDPSGALFMRARLVAAHGVDAAPSSSRFEGILLHAEGAMRSDTSGIPLALLPDGGVAAALALIGKGRAVRVLGPLLANERLFQGDTLPFALALISDLRAGGDVLFDEFHQGYGGFAPGEGGLDPRALLAAAAAGAAAIVLYALARGVRFGPEHPRVEGARRSALEFVDSLADLYRRAGFRKHALTVLGSAFSREAHRRREIPVDARGPEMAAALARGSGSNESRLAAVLREMTEAVEGAAPAEKDMTRLARLLTAMQKEIFDER